MDASCFTLSTTVTAPVFTSRWKYLHHFIGLLMERRAAVRQAGQVHCGVCPPQLQRLGFWPKLGLPDGHTQLVWGVKKRIILVLKDLAFAMGMCWDQCNLSPAPSWSWLWALRKADTAFSRKGLVLILGYGNQSSHDVLTNVYVYFYIYMRNTLRNRD